MPLFSRLLLLLLFLAASGPLLAQDPPEAGDGPEAAPATFEARLKRIPYFQKITWTTDATYAPFEILIQKQAVPEPNFERMVAQSFGPWLQQMAKIFDESVAAPAKLEPALDPKPIRLIVLLTEGDYLNYSKTVIAREGFGRTAHYDERIRSIVTYWDFAAPAYTKRYPVLRRLVFALLHQRSSAISGRQPPLWIREGLSGSLTWHLGSDPTTAFAKPLLNPAALQRLVALSQDSKRQNVLLLPLRSLAGVLSADDVFKRVTEQAATASIEIAEGEPWYENFLFESILWAHFLRREGAVAHNRAFDEYLRACMRGGGSPVDLEKAFDGQDLTSLDREFFQWVHARAREIGEVADDSKLASLFAQPSSALGSKGISGPALAARLAPPIDDPNVVHALALRKASHGDIEGALADLEKRLERAGEDANAASFRTEIARLNAWKVARDTWLAEQVAAGAKIQLERDGKKLFFKAAKLENGVLRLEAAKNKEEVPVISLKPALLAAQMKTTPAQSPEWVRSYAMLLCADERWAKLLKDKSEQSQALRLDADKRYAELSKLGLAAEHLAILAQSVSPADAPAANSVLERLHRIRLEVATQPLILQRIESLLQLARIAAEKVYDESRPAPEFGGKANWLDSSTLELTYEFTSPAELDDWVERPDDMKDWRASWNPIVVPQSQQSFKLADGVWAGQGSFVFRHVLPFEAPMNMRVSVRHGKAADETADSGHFTMGICDDGAGNFPVFESST